LITSIIDHLKGKIKNLGSYFNNLIKSQYQASATDKPYKPRASRAHKTNKAGLSPIEGIELDLDLEDEKMFENQDFVSKKRLRPRMSVLNYKEMDEGMK